MTLPLNTILNYRYRIENVIGKGGFGITYYARHIHTGKEYAIKELFISDQCERGMDGRSVIYYPSDSDKFLQFKVRFIREAQTMIQLNHPNVVHVLDVFEENNTAYIVMDFVKGRNLQQIIDTSGPLNYPLAVNYMAQLAEAVQHCHEHQILHRDIKPENVMITPDNKVVLIDFGSARHFIHNVVQPHTTILTPGYAPLEQYTSTSLKGNYSDIYSLGAVFYFILTGRIPMSATERLENQMPAPKSIVSTIPNEANTTILKAMQMKVHNRYQSVPEFMDALLGNKKKIVMSPGGISKNNSWLIWTIIGGVLLSILLAVVGIRTLKNHTTPPSESTPISEPDTIPATPELSQPYEPYKNVEDDTKSNKKPVKKSATINRVWFEENYYRNGQRGMLIHVNFDVTGMKDQEGEVDAYFYYADGSPIEDQNGNKQFTTGDGQVDVYKSYTPQQDERHYDNFELFIPNSELHLDEEIRSSCYFVIQVWGTNSLLAKSLKKQFTYRNIALKKT